MLYILHSAQVVLFTQDKFAKTAIHYGNFVVFDQIGTDWITGCLIGGIGKSFIGCVPILRTKWSAPVAFTVQSYYAWRIHAISGRRFPTILILLVRASSV